MLIESEALNPRTRSEAPGAFVELSDGTVHYELSGPDNAQVVALVHGALSPFFIWDHLVPVLHQAGFRSLRYDNYGRGWSDRPTTRYDADLYVRQLVELLDALELTEPVHLAGVSQGGAIASATTARHPDRVDRVALLAPAGLPRERSLPERLARLPLLGEAVMALVGPTLILRGQSHSLASRAKYGELRDHLTPQMRFKGFKRSMLAMLRDFPMNDLRSDFEALGQGDHDVLLVWGTDDRILPFELSKLARVLLPNAEFHAVEGGGHIVHWEEPERVNPLLIGFFGR